MYVCKGFSTTLDRGFSGSDGSGLVAKSCPTLCDPMDCSPPGSSVHGIFKARMLGRGGGGCFHFLLQEIFPTKGLNSHFQDCRWILYH